jgi:hypothetical protein
MTGTCSMRKVDERRFHYFSRMSLKEEAILGD